MKILLRYLDGKEYVWRDAVFDKNINCFKINGVRVYETNIISVFEDDRNEYVQCSICGATFKKGSKEIQEHITPTTDTSKCFECARLRTTNITNSKTTYELVENNTYKAVETYNTNLQCSAIYPYTNINTQDARIHCIYNRCANAKINEFADFFTQFPEAFDSIITADVIEEADNYVEKYISSNHSREYKLNCRNTVWASTNKLGIVDHFVINYKRESYSVFYSKKYNKLFYSRNSKYTEWRLSNMPESSYNIILNKIAELYS